ncbi:MAG TPA: MFS transporter [Bacteroidota bacterium]|jgi:ACS family hexuronate transporter-like MFS transporter|nr:MFS transporter [Bacteroidota bacterium]
MKKEKGYRSYRWVILSLVFFATTINYLDRQVISLLKDDYLEPLFNWSESDYANIVIAFQLAYAIGMLGVGWVIDRIGTKIGYALSLALWSISAIGHAFARSTIGFIFARAILGISESGNFPAAIKTVAEWFPKKERALATGLFNSGANIGAIIAPLTVPLIALYFGWQWAFIITGSIGLFWLFFWFIIYESPDKHKKVSRAELEYINSDIENDNKSENEKVKWITLLKYKQTWSFIVGKFLTDPVWWFYLFWLPSFLNKQYGMTKTEVALPIAIVYTMTTFGSIFGGWLSGRLITSGWQIYKARKISLLIFALCVVPVILAQELGKYNPWFAVLIVGLAASSHQAWSANLFTTVSDMFPKKAVASVTGIGGMTGAIGGILISFCTGLILDYYKSIGNIDIGYYIMFIFCGLAYILAWIIFTILSPKMEVVKI